MGTHLRFAAAVGAVIFLLSGCTGSGDPAPSQPPVTAGVPDSLDVRDLPAQEPTSAGWFRLQTQFSQQSDRCLEANAPAEDSYLSGASFMDACQNVTGQAWQMIVSDQDGYVRLQPRSGVDLNQCLDGDQPGSPAHLSSCSSGASQLWRTVTTEGGFLLQSQDAAAANLCLEGNLVGPAALQDGATFQDDCQNVTGQVWVAVDLDDALAETTTTRELLDLRESFPVILDEDLSVRYQLQITPGAASSCLSGGDPSTAARLLECAADPGQSWQVLPTSLPDVYRLQTQSAVADQLCLAGPAISPDAELAGAAHQVPCTDNPAQQWRMVADQSGYRLQPLSEVANNGCLEGNPAEPQARLDGASYVDLCQTGSGQLWTLTPVPGTAVVPATAPTR